MQFEKFVYLACRNGHWFTGGTCPVDGYRDPFIDTVLKAVASLRDRGESLSMATLAMVTGLREESFGHRVMIVEMRATESEEELPCFLPRTG